jgi:subtilisin family serine protease
MARPWTIIAAADATEAEVVSMSQELPDGIATHPSTGEAPMVMGSLAVSDLQAFISNHPGRLAAVVEDVFSQRVDPPMIPSVSAASSVASTYPWGIQYLNADVVRGKGAGVSVYVLDTGVRITHNEFGGRAFAGVDVAASGGYPGTLALCSPSNATCADDQHGHGSHCAGTVGASTYGVADGASIWAMKVLSNAGSGWTSWQIMAEQWILSTGNRPAVVSTSIQANYNDYGQQTSIDALVADGVTVVVAAGNAADDACSWNPAWISSAITVAAFGGNSGSSWDRSGYSNYGSCIDVYAPGTSILSLGPFSDTQTYLNTGTSMACPHVAGLAARMYEAYPTAGSMTAAERWNLLTAINCTGCVTNDATPIPTVNLVAGAAPFPTPSPTTAPPTPSPTASPTPYPTLYPTPSPTP